MKNSIKIVSGKLGWHLQVNGLFISATFLNDSDIQWRGIKAIICRGGVPYGATEWVSVAAIREFWHKYMHLIIASTQMPHESVWGQLKPVFTLKFQTNGKDQKGYIRKWSGFGGWTKELDVMFKLIKSCYPTAIIKLQY